MWRCSCTTGLSEVAGREAYLAAQAILFERTGRAVKTHRGLRSAFSLLAHGDPAIGSDLTYFSPMLRK